MKLHTFILTRFNTKIRGQRNWRGIDPIWLAYRFNFFERFALPSIASQTDKDFRWLVFFDKETPEPFRSLAQAYHNICPQYEAFFVDEPFSIEPVEINYAIANHIAKFGKEEEEEEEEEEEILTIRLSSDNALAVDAVEKLRASALHFLECAPERKFFLTAPNGCSYSVLSGIWQDNYYISNPCIALVTDIFGADHILCLTSRAKLREIKGFAWHICKSRKPLWLSVVHEMNTACRLLNYHLPAYHTTKFARKRFGIVLKAQPRLFFRSLILEYFPHQIKVFFRDLGLLIVRPRKTIRRLRVIAHRFR